MGEADTLDAFEFDGDAFGVSDGATEVDGGVCDQDLACLGRTTWRPATLTVSPITLYCMRDDDPT